jgi:hypothetical protein
MPYPARQIPFDPRDYASYESLQRIAAFEKGADAANRQSVIDYLVTAQAFNKDHTTKSLVYSGKLNQPGRNVAGNIEIGPLAFEQDLAWLAGVVFHELVHSPQYAYYLSKGISQIDPKRTETERRMIALDEYEAYCWTLKRKVELALAQTQEAEIRRRAGYALIDLDDPKAHDLAKGQQFDAARDELIQQLNAANSAANHAAVAPRKSLACYA